MKKLFVVGLAALLLVAFSVPAMADVKMGGIIFTDFYYITRDKDNMFNPNVGNESYNNTAIQVPDITRLYGRWTNEDNVGMYIEFGIGYTGSIESIVAASGQADNAVNVRHAYGWWDVNPMFQIMAGHSTTPFSPLNPSQLLGERSGSLNIIGVGYGDYYAGRFAQVRGTFNFAKVAKLEIALVDPNGNMGYGNIFPTAYRAQNTMIPRVDVSVPLYLGPVHLYPGILWQRRGVDFAAGGAHPDDSITTWIATLGAKLGFGPFGFSGEFQYGENWGNTRGLAGASAPARLASATLKTNTNINNAETYSWWAEASYKFGVITPSLIYGQMKSKSLGGMAPYVAINPYAKSEAKSQMYGISVPIDLAKGFRLRPEIMWYDDGDLKIDGQNSYDLGKYMIAGVQFQITF